jgi:hypothetical protein
MPIHFFQLPQLLLHAPNGVKTPGPAVRMPISAQAWYVTLHMERLHL